tara:strand:- start:30 stop:731 length:702 start_codon:yes stop_codon:yes gene_type:complete
MSSKTIHYINVNHKQFDDSLVRQSDLDDDRFVYGKCPVYKHKSSRTFVGISPIDFKLQVMKSPDGITTIRSTNQSILEGDEDHINSPRPVIQLKFPRFVFWTQEDDIWFDFTDHPMTSLVNNFIAVGGWFNLSNWSRGSSLGLTIVNPSKPVIIKKGDPLFRMSFHSSNPDDVINLSQEKDPDKIDYIWNEYDRWRKEDLKIFDTRSTKDLWKSKLFSKTNTTSKCPFSFLFK